MKSRTRFGEQIRLFDRRPRIIPGRRFAVVVAVVASLGWAAGGAGADTVDATVYQSGGGTSTSTADLTNCHSTYSGPTSWEQDGTNGITTATIGQPVWSIEDVLRCMSPAIPGVTQVTMVRSDGSLESAPNSELAPADLVPGNFPAPDDRAVPVIFDSFSTLYYLRPWRGGSDNDQIDTINGNGSLQMRVFEGTVISPVTISASQTTVPAGTPVTFSASVPPGHPNLSYEWSFEGLPDSTQVGPTITFSAGYYEVTLQVIDTSTGQPGEAPPIYIDVKGSTPPQPTTPTAPTAPTGPAGSSGVVPKQGQGKSPSKNTGRLGHHQGESSTSPGARKHKPAKHAPTQSSTGSRSGSSSGSAASGGLLQAATTFSGARSATPVHGPKPASAGTAHGVRVDGLLISDVRLLPASESPLVHALPSGGTAPVLRRPAGPSAVPALAAALGVVLLFGLGAGRELRWRLARRPSLRFGS